MGLAIVSLGELCHHLVSKLCLALFFYDRPFCLSFSRSWVWGSIILPTPCQFLGSRSRPVQRGRSCFSLTLFPFPHSKPTMALAPERKPLLFTAAVCMLEVLQTCPRMRGDWLDRKYDCWLVISSNDHSICGPHYRIQSASVSLFFGL